MVMKKPKIAIVNYQAGNLRSVQKALEWHGAVGIITSNPDVIECSDALVFPGQGANDSSMKSLRSKGLIEPLTQFISSGKPFLGVCLGLQLLFNESEEGNEPGLGVLDGKVKKLPTSQKIPQMGWNRVIFNDFHPIIEGVPEGSHFYFVHSYYAEPEDSNIVTGKTVYGIEFCSAVGWDNVLAVQFHPEKSGANGLLMYKNFVKLARV